MPEPARLDETVPGGRYIRGGKPGPDGKHYGGDVVDAHGHVLESYEPGEANPGRVREKPAKAKAAKAESA